MYDVAESSTCQLSLSLPLSLSVSLSVSLPLLPLFLPTCTADTPYIIFGNRVAIHQIRLNGTNRIELQQGPDPNSDEVVDIRGLDFDFK